MYFGRVNFDLVKPFDIWKVVSGSGSFENEAEPEIFLWESVERVINQRISHFR
jgi:hypothetical protein